MRAGFISEDHRPRNSARQKGRLREDDHGWSPHCHSTMVVERAKILGPLHHPDRTGVLRYQGVDGQQRNPLDRRLCHQDSVERILMNRWQAIDGNNVIADDWQLAVPVGNSQRNKPRYRKPRFAR
jgi:hypothetical protein